MRPSLSPALLCSIVFLWNVPIMTHGAHGEDIELPERVEFNQHVRPILSDKCFACHGPDAQNQKADLRLDLRDSALQERDGFRAITAGDPAKSEALVRCLSSDPDEQMPPPSAKLGRLAPREIAILRRWIEQGAEYQPHWAFVRPQRAELPEVENGGWVRNPIDTFVLARLEHEGLAPSPPAEKTTLLRRVTLDLTGLPPTSEEIDSFLDDSSPDAYERVVERLLSSPRFGERMALPWLDGARYADTNGYQADLERTMWPWRDWVIRAFNENKPYDQFTIEQLAGDLLPGATHDQIIATGFNRNHRINGEAGIVPEEYLVEYVVDRVETTSAVWLGLTTGCARCHDHKYDPITQREFYELFAFFNHVPEAGKDGRRGQPPPMIGVPTPEQERELARLGAEIAAIEKALAAHDLQADARFAQWDAAHPDAESSLREALDRALSGRFLMDQARGGANLVSGGSGKGRLRGGAWVPFEKPQGARHSALLSGSNGVKAPAAGFAAGALQFDGNTWVNGFEKTLAQVDRDSRFAFALWVQPAERAAMPLLEREDELANNRGFHLMLDKAGCVQFQLAYNDENNAIRVVTTNPLAPGEWQHVAASYDGSGRANGVRIFIGGELTEVRVVQDSLVDSLRDGVSNLSIGGGTLRPTFRGTMHDVRIYERPLTQVEVATLAGRDSLGGLLATPAAERTTDDSAALREYFLEHHDLERRGLLAKLTGLRGELGAVDAKVVKTMVMRDVPNVRATHVLKRGEYDKPGEVVNAAIPAWLGKVPADAPPNRLGFARWLVSPENPLTARVAVNRFWQMLFGTGLVKTSEDFGSQGELPSHPELLDWLAVAFQSPQREDSAGSLALDRQLSLGWDVKALLRLVVTSATYQQSSRITPQLRERDPENRLLARGPRFRLPAQAVRDNALAISGLLVDRVGGPSVKPYQPEGLWEEVSFQRKDVPTDFYKPDTGEGLYRRSLYTFWKRTVNPPTMQLFDASGREVCSVRPRITNTPLQALALLNEVTFVEAARALAQRMLRGADTNADALSEPSVRLRHGWRIALSREPGARELATLLGSLEKHRARFAADPAAAEALLKVGDFPVPADVDRIELAAYTAVANTILNLDEAITKE